MQNREIYEELKSDFNQKNKRQRASIKQHGKYKNIFYFILLFCLLLPNIVLFLMKKPYEYVEDLDNLPEPTQTSTSWWTVMKIGWVDVYIDFLAEYDISWRVISIRDYIWADVIRKLWPRDFTIGWWKLWRTEYINKFNWNDMKDRFIYYRLKKWNENRFKEEFWSGRWQTLPTSFLISFSNNHPIPSNRKIKLLMKKIKEGDTIRLKWYLIYAHRKTKNNLQRRWWPSSLVRTDNWDGACEIIYVTDISRLKEK